MNKYFKLLAWSCAGIVAGATIYFSYEGAAVLAVAAGVFKGFSEFMKGQTMTDNEILRNNESERQECECWTRCMG